MLYLCGGFETQVMQNILRQFGNIPITTSVLRTVLPPRTSFTHFVSSLVDANQLIRIKRGLYVVSPDISGKSVNPLLVANSLYGPSYISYGTALNHYGLIDDLTQRICSATTKCAKTYTTPIGIFEYVHLPAGYYSVGITQVRGEDYSYLIATPQKALCDMIIHSSWVNLRSRNEALTYLEEDLRFDTEALRTFDVRILEDCARFGIKANSIQQLIRLVQS